ncbi:Efflux pump membrane transporter BepE [Caulifigura coniformis]|uniref:Efflux pump membrane transporter BepE n=1 Tax=Caulifigura coniformis TaxID=2527983 RepID=A0A517SLE8_9PLAN|nr:multidrug efflux RND transporter permease subunit [Caulifigura coniformis]QDT56947.1 Efflux pump membrane transporter BepE [Caulifigura coniformis]
MRIAHFFIDRPIFATVVSFVIIILGGISYVSLPAALYPDVVPPTIVVRASYPGASPEVIADSVATPIEQEVNGVEDMLYMSSQCTTDGAMALTITFRLGTDLDKAQVLVQNRVAIAEARLPEEVRRLGVTTIKSSPDLLLVIHLISPGAKYNQEYVGNYGFIQLKDTLARIDGVGDVLLNGLREYSMRIWLDPDRLAHLSLTPGDVIASLREQNVQVASGVIGQPPVPNGNAFQLSINTLGRLIEPGQFENIIVRTGANGRVVRVKDVARIELGARDYTVESSLDGEPAVAMIISQRPGSNALATATAVEETIAELAKGFPEGVDYRIIYNPTVFVRESIDAVLRTLNEAVILVVIVVLVFLQNWRASLIPLLAIPVSLIGTFAAMSAFGFSLNMLSLFGLVLAIGIVVDDAIVVVENVERHIANGLSPRAAAYKAMDEVTVAVIAIAIGLSAVFIPTAFVGGLTGQFYRQFALTIAVSTLISAFNSLTLAPAMCAILLQPHGAKRDWFSRIWDFAFGWFFRLFNRGFDWSSSVYGRTVRWLFPRAFLPLGVYVGLLVITGYGFQKAPTGFIPPSDMGYMIAMVQLPDGASVERTSAVVNRAVKTILEHPGVDHAISYAGYSGTTRSASSNYGSVFIMPKPFHERLNGPKASDIQKELQPELSKISDATIFIIPPPPVRGLGTAGGFKFLVQDRGGAGYKELQKATDDLIAAAARDSSLSNVFTTYRATTPQLYANVDRVKASMLNVPIANVFEALQVNLGSAYVNDLNLFGRVFQVRVQSEGDFRTEAEDVTRLKTRNANGKMVPLGSVLDMEWKSGPDRVVRYNMYPSAEVQGDTAPGRSSGEAMATIERLAEEVLPPGMTIAWTDIAYQQQLAGNTAAYIFPLCVLFVFLVHSAEYESWMLPLAIILIAPVCLPFALGGVLARGMDNNLITQIGFIVLIGLAAKNAVLIVEFSKHLEDGGMNRFDATVEACRLRLRPIMMTSFAFILGVLPLAIAKGPGAEIRQVLGTAVFAGMLGVTVFGLFLTPTFYVVLRGVSLRFWNRGRNARSHHEEGHSGHALHVEGHSVNGSSDKGEVSTAAHH